jgi:hypothetical protein
MAAGAGAGAPTPTTVAVAATAPPSNGPRSRNPSPNPTAGPTTTAVNRIGQFELTVDAPAIATVGTSQIVKVRFRNLGAASVTGFTLETQLESSSGTLVAYSGTGGLMPAGYVVEDSLSLACNRVVEVPGSTSLEGPCEPGVYRITQTVSSNGTVIGRQVTATIRFQS